MRGEGGRMEIRDVSIVWEKGISGYRQGIKGRKNFRHKEKGNFIMVTAEFTKVFRESYIY